FPDTTSEVDAKDIEPFPATENEVLEHLTHVAALWTEHADTLRDDPTGDQHTAVKMALLEAYNTIRTMAAFLAEDTTELILSKETLEAARFELWFARHHLYKVIK
ncbi:MAG TPA: hypothetical protein VFZ62_04860, partial [Candidatus Saccharimonadales bacterium]